MTDDHSHDHGDTTSMTNTDLISSDRWNFSSATTSDSTITAMYNLFLQGMYLDINADGTYSGMAPGDSGMQAIHGSWEFSMNETYLVLYEDNDTTALELNSLTADELSVGFTEEMDDCTSIEVDYIFVH